MTRTASLALGLALAAGPACLDPQVSDAVPYDALLLPAGATVPAASDALAARIDALDAVDALVPLRTAFAAGAAVRYWDFGEAPTAAAPIWVIVKDDPAGTFRANGRTFSAVGQPNVIDVVPGDPTYSPFWVVYLVPVTERWSGQLVTSAAAIEAGATAGLLEAPIRRSIAVNCPVVAATTRLDQGAGQPQRVPDHGYYRGVEVAYFSFGAAPVSVAGMVAAPPAYRLRREGGEPLDEAIRGVDMTGDGDRLDSNDLFSAARDDDAYTGLVNIVDVVVRADYASIDTSGDETVADATDAAQLYRGPDDPDPSWVVAVYPSATIANRPVQDPEEAP